MSSSAEDRPPPRDPLLDDPAFAELVGPPPLPPPAPVFAEPVDAPVESLPVAEVIRPKAAPVPPTASPKISPQIKLPVPVGTEPPRPQWFAACGVIGCLGILLIAAIAALLWIAITLLSNIGDKFGDVKSTGRSEAADKVQRGPVAPTLLVNDIELSLPGRVDAVARGGGGRFLLMRITSKREIHVFDANQAQLVYSVPSKEAGTLFAASADKIFVCDPLEGRLHRFGLFSGELELTEKLPIEMPRALVVGGASSGPLRVVTSANRKLKIHHIDTGTLKPVKADEFTFPLKSESAMLARASENNSVLGVSCDDGAVAIWYGTGNPTAKLLFDRNPKPRWVVPSPDGRFLYTPRGVFDSGGSPFAGTRSGEYSFPAAHGDDWYLTLDEADETVTGQPQRRPAGDRDLAKAKGLDKAFLATTFPANDLQKDQLTAADRIHYWPRAGLAAVLPYTRAEEVAKLQLFKLPVDEK